MKESNPQPSTLDHNKYGHAKSKMAALKASQTRPPHTLQNGGPANRYLLLNGRASPVTPCLQSRRCGVLSWSGSDTSARGSYPRGIITWWEGSSLTLSTHVACFQALVLNMDSQSDRVASSHPVTFPYMEVSKFSTGKVRG